jgi:hypothetical protein
MACRTTTTLSNYSGATVKETQEGAILLSRKVVATMSLTDGVALNFFVDGDHRCFHIMHACLVSRVACLSHVLSLATIY